MIWLLNGFRATQGTRDAPTFFEIMTASALAYFADQAVDVVILETGLGGRLDCTNVVNTITQSGGEAFGMEVDVSDEKQVADLVAKTVETFGKVIEDPMCGFRVYPVPAACEIAPRCGERMDFDIEVAVRLVWLGLPVCLWLALQPLRYWTIATLGDRWTTRVIVLPGGTPITGGPYRLMRHPNYAIVAAEIVVLPAALAALALTKGPVAGPAVAIAALTLALRRTVPRRRT